jgi:hypothetical protein
MLIGLFLVTVAAAAAAPVKLLIDTDAGFDVDDVGAVCLANALQDNGEAEIVGVGHTNGYNKGIGSVSTLMHFYDRDDVPLGAYKGLWAANPRAPGAKGTSDRYIPDLVKGYPSPVKNYSTVPSAAAAYRKILAAQPDNSVHIAAIGITTNMRDLVASQPDSASLLNGHDLIAQKVNMIVWMDMMYNFGCAQHDTDNWLGPDTDCRGSAKAAVMGWPSSVKQIFSPLGGDVQHGNWLSTCAARGNPCRQAFEDWLGPRQTSGRHSWDPIAVMIAVRGAEGIHCKEFDQGGRNEVSETGKETWVGGQPGQSNQSRVSYSGADAQSKISLELNQLLCQAPGGWLNSTAGWNAALGENCYTGHGATNIDGLSCGSFATLEECSAKCLEQPGCTAVTVHVKGGKFECYRKADVVLSKCDHSTGFDTYVRQKWLLAEGANCWPGHGATDVGSGWGTMDVRSCQKKCEATPGCSAVTWSGKDHSGVGACYGKKSVSVGKCDHGTSFDTYLANRAF